MLTVLRRFFSPEHYRSKNTARIVFVALQIFLVLVIAIRPAPAHAACFLFTCTAGDFANAIVSIIIAPLGILILGVIGLILGAINFILVLVLIVTGAVMSTVMNFAVSVPYTPANQLFIDLAKAGAPNAVTVGWTVVRDVANMGLLFVLIAIAIGTMLQIGATRWRSLFIPFVVIALLINFTPVITGLVIDLSNILTKVFFDGAGEAWRVFANVFIKTGTTDVFKTLSDSFRNGFDADTIASTIFGGILTMLFTMILSILSIAAFVTTTLLLLARIVALWLLVILSPLAFVAYILPATKHYFSGWWHNFFQWSIIGIPLGFFLWLAARFVAGAETLCGRVPSFSAISPTSIAGSVSAGGANFSTIVQNNPFLSGTQMCQSMILLMAIGALFVGFMIAFSMSAMGSKLVVGAGLALGAGIGGWAAANVGGLAMRGAERVGGAVARRLPEEGGRVGRIPGIPTRETAQRLGEHIGVGRRTAVSGLEKRVGTLGPAGGALARGTGKGREISEKTALVKVLEATSAEKKKKFDQETANLRKESAAWGDGDWNQRLRTVPGMPDEKTMATVKIASDKGINIADKRFKLSQNQLNAIYEKSADPEYKILPDIARNNPTNVVNNASDKALMATYKTANRDEAREKIFQGIAPSHLKGENKLSEETLEGIIGDPADSTTLDQFADWAQHQKLDHLRAVAESYGPAMAKRLDQQLQNLKTRPDLFAQVADKNKGFIRQSYKNPAWEEQGYQPLMPNKRAFDDYLVALSVAKAAGGPLPDPNTFMGGPGGGRVRGGAGPSSGAGGGTPAGGGPAGGANPPAGQQGPIGFVIPGVRGGRPRPPQQQPPPAPPSPPSQPGGGAPPAPTPSPQPPGGGSGTGVPTAILSPGASTPQSSYQQFQHDLPAMQEEVDRWIEAHPGAPREEIDALNRQIVDKYERARVSRNAAVGGGPAAPAPTLRSGGGSSSGGVRGSGPQAATPPAQSQGKEQQTFDQTQAQNQQSSRQAQQIARNTQAQITKLRQDILEWGRERDNLQRERRSGVDSPRQRVITKRLGEIGDLIADNQNQISDLERP